MIPELIKMFSYVPSSLRWIKRDFLVTSVGQTESLHYRIRSKITFPRNTELFS